MKKLIHDIQWFKEAKYDIIESNGFKKYIVTAPFTRTDVPNGNNRVYPRRVMQEAINNLRPRVINKEITMMVDHPSMESSLRNVGALLLDISDVDENGYAYYTAQIADTAAGKDLKALIDLDAKLGVSTRGSGTCAVGQDVPGYPGKYDVILDGFVLESIDFVDDPSVKDTKTYVKYENKKRSVSMKSVEELKAAFPELMNQHEQMVRESVTKELSENSTKVLAEKKQLEAAVSGLTDVIKAVCPTAFTIVESKELVKKHEEEVCKLEKELKEAKDAKEKAEKALKDSEAKHIKEAKDLLIESLVKTNDFLAMDCFKNIFENCETKEDVQKIFERNKEIYDKIKADSIKTSAPKSVITDAKDANKPESKNANGLTEEQVADFETKNRLRAKDNLAPLTVEEYKSIMGI